MNKLTKMSRKNKMKRVVLSFLMSMTILLSFGQQETQYTQFMFNKLMLNPAYAGARGLASFTGIYRNQWAGFKGSPESQLISFNAPLFGDRVGFGLTVSNHKIGIMNSWYGTMAYSYHVKLDEKAAIRIGIQGSIRHLGINFADPDNNPRQMNDPSMIPDDRSSDYNGNFGAGLYLTYDWLYFGVSVPRLFPNEIGFTNIPEIAKEVPHFYAMAGAMIPLTNTKLHFKPAVLTKYVRNAPFDMDINLSLVYDLKLTGGVSYRIGGVGSGDSVDLLLMYQFQSVALGIAYDFPLTDFSKYSSGSFEGLLRYDFVKEREDMANPRFFY